MTLVKTVFIGVLLIVLVQGQYDYDILKQDSYGNDELSSDDAYGQEPEIVKRNAIEERFKAIYNRIQQNVANNHELAAELINELATAENSQENGNNNIQGDAAFDENGIHGDENSDIGNDYPSSDNADGVQRKKRFFKDFGRKLKGFGRKVGHFGKTFLGNLAGGGGGVAAGGGLGALGGGGGLGFLAKLFGR